MNKHRLPLLLISIGLVSSPLFSCAPNQIVDKDISIIYTTDVHCGLDLNLGYSALSHYKKTLKKTNYVSLVDAGDYLQGEFVGLISKGEYIIDVMNKVGYDVVTLGNHEFDYGIDVLSSRLKELKSDITSCNFSYIGKKENKLKMIKPYSIKKYGNRKIGYVGVTTPTTLVEADPRLFLEDGELAYSFSFGTVEEFYNTVQSNIDECKSKGADYIILLSHLGSLKNYEPYSSIDVISHTSGVTAVLDGHAHVDLPWTTYKNKDNIDTLLVDTGYKLNDFASLTISKDGSISHEFINSYEDRDPVIDNYIKSIEDRTKETGDKVVASSDTDLSITNEDGIRLVRNGELPIGNFVSDAYREIAETDIGFINGGGIRDSLLKGDVTLKDALNVHPFGNTLMKKKVTGASLIDYLELGAMDVAKERIKDGKPYGENGSFVHVSGLKYTIDTSIETTVELDENGNFVEVKGDRRVKDIQVLENDTYVPINPNKEYTVASNDFVLNGGGGGANMFIQFDVDPDSNMPDYQALIDYLVKLKGQLKDKYSSIEGRITVI